MTKRKRTKG